MATAARSRWHVCTSCGYLWESIFRGSSCSSCGRVGTVLTKHTHALAFLTSELVYRKALAR